MIISTFIRLNITVLKVDNFMYCPQVWHGCIIVQSEVNEVSVYQGIQFNGVLLNGVLFVL